MPIGIRKRVFRARSPPAEVDASSVSHEEEIYSKQ